MSINDLVGQRFGRLTVIKDTGRRSRCKRVIWLCQCRCGNFTEVRGDHLRDGSTKSCRCLSNERSGYDNYKHGGHGTKLYAVWVNMNFRCLNSRCQCYKHYGGRGIKVCDEWGEDFSVFRDFALAHGYREGLVLDRRDNDGDYEPSNVQFLTPSEHAIKGTKIRRRENGRFSGGEARC